MKRLFLTMAFFFAFVSIAMAESNEVFPGERDFPASEDIELSFPSYINEDTLAEDYISSMLPAVSSRPVLRASRPSGLIQFPAGSANRNLYLALRNEIALTANGENNKQYDDNIGGMSTIFAIPAADIFPCTSFSAADLGVDSLFTEDGALSEAAKAAFWSKVEEMIAAISFPDVAFCIVNDSPYELYWFGRTAGVLANDFAMGVEEDVKLVLEGNYRVLFNVSVDYAVSDETNVIDGTAYRTWLDTDKFGSVARAKKKIDEIRVQVSGMTDEGKMAYFAEQICGLVSYNYEAEAEFKAGTREYGDPWQLVWVFDTRSEQKVVCEGYSKAFAYLCELCTNEAECILVWGSIPAGKHMWNVVNYKNHNYMVDLTNYDLGYDLYMVGADGNPVDGYDTAAVKGYVYNREQTKRSDEELTIEAYSYSDWKAATTEAPRIRISSEKTYPGYQVALKAESSNGVMPVERLTIIKGDTSEEFIPENGIVLLSLEQDEEIAVFAVVDGETTPTTEAISITVGELPEPVFSLPAGSRIEFEAFSGIAAELIWINENDIAPGAFDPETVLAVDEAGEWFDSGYRFVIRPQARNGEDR